MAFANYTAMLKKFDSGRMAENIRRLKEYNLFHCLLAGNAERAEAVKNRIPGLPNDFLAWLEVCDGGVLFDTTMLTTKPNDPDLDLDFETYASYTKAPLRQSKSLADDWFIFATAIHDDVYFFDMEKKDGKVYQWDVEQREIYTVWKTFEDWLTDQINEAVELIADEQLEPLDIKLEVDGDE